MSIDDLWNLLTWVHGVSLAQVRAAGEGAARCFPGDALHTRRREDEGREVEDEGRGGIEGGEGKKGRRGHIERREKGMRS